MAHSSFRAGNPQFKGLLAGPTFPVHQMPTKTTLFSHFWADQTLLCICIETNCYTNQVLLNSRFLIERGRWWRLKKVELKAYIAINLLTRIKKLPNHHCYWNRGNQFLYCPSISSIMTCRHYEDITRCIHVADDRLAGVPEEEAKLDRLKKMHWLLAVM